MSSFIVALIRFSKNGRTYSVNCADYLEPGTRVVVRMGGQANALQRAEVVKITSKDKPCKNTIVCLEEEAEAYGSGPEGVETADDLHRFLDVLHWHRYTTLQWDGFGAAKKTIPCEEWPVAYEWGNPHVHSSWKLRGPTEVILIGPQGPGYFACGNNMRYFEVLDGKLVIDWFVRKLGKECLSSEEGLVWRDINPYYHAARIAERNLIWDTNPHDYRGQSSG